MHERPLRSLAVGSIVGIVAVGLILVLVNDSPASRSSSSAQIYGTASCTASSATDSGRADDVESAQVQVTKSGDLAITVHTKAVIPESGEVPGSAEPGFTFTGGGGRWWINIYNPNLGGWQAYVQGDVEGAAPDDYDASDFTGDAYVGDSEAVTVEGSTLTVHWPYGRYLDARTRGGDRLSLEGWSVAATYSDAVCPPSGDADFPA